MARFFLPLPLLLLMDTGDAVGLLLDVVVMGAAVGEVGATREIDGRKCSSVHGWM